MCFVPFVTFLSRIFFIPLFPSKIYNLGSFFRIPLNHLTLPSLIKFPLFRISCTLPYHHSHLAHSMNLLPHFIFPSISEPFSLQSFSFLFVFPFSSHRNPSLLTLTGNPSHSHSHRNPFTVSPQTSLLTITENSYSQSHC